jgi:hypothetical protein
MDDLAIGDLGAGGSELFWNKSEQSDSSGPFSCRGAVYVGGIRVIWTYMGGRGFVPICFLN